MRKLGSNGRVGQIDREDRLHALGLRCQACIGRLGDRNEKPALFICMIGLRGTRV